MKHITCFFLCLLILASVSHADDTATVPYDFLTGSYECIGRWPDSSRTYSGRVEIFQVPGGIKMMRTIGRERTEALGKYETATADKIPVLKVRFKRKGISHEETCLVSMDLNNYARLTCYVYTGETKKVGLETLFPDYGRLEQK